MMRPHEFAEVIGQPRFVGKVIELPENVAADAVARLGKQFVTQPGSGWWWENLRKDLPQFAYAPPDEDAYRLLPIVCPDREVLFFVSGDEAPPWAGFRAHPRILAAAIAQSSAFEYVVADPNGEWLLMENHHGVLAAIGDPVSTSLRQRAARELG